MRALHEYLAQEWEARLVAKLPGSFDESTAADRARAYALVSAIGASRAELSVMIDARVDPDLNEIWNDVADRWIPPLSTLSSEDPASLAELMTFLAADGLWVSDVIGGYALTTRQREVLASHLADSLNRAGRDSD